MTEMNNQRNVYSK